MNIVRSVFNALPLRVTSSEEEGTPTPNATIVLMRLSATPAFTSAVLPDRGPQTGETARCMPLFLSCRASEEKCWEGRSACPSPGGEETTATREIRDRIFIFGMRQFLAGQRLDAQEVVGGGKSAVRHDRVRETIELEKLQKTATTRSRLPPATCKHGRLAGPSKRVA